MSDEDKIMSIEDLIPAPEDYDPYHIVLKNEINSILTSGVLSLTPVEQYVIVQRFSVDSKTMKVIGEELDMSKQSISNIQLKALKKIKTYLKANNITKKEIFND